MMDEEKYVEVFEDTLVIEDTESGEHVELKEQGPLADIIMDRFGANYVDKLRNETTNTVKENGVRVRVRHAPNRILIERIDKK